MPKSISNIPKMIPIMPIEAPIAIAGIPQAKVIIPNGMGKTIKPRVPQIIDILARIRPPDETCDFTASVLLNFVG